ncbi:anthranilate synthase component II [Halopiger thermotolerans]
MILVVDNYDSFAYNLVQYVAEALAPADPAATPRDVGEFDGVIVRRNDEIDLEGVRDLDPDGIVVSPGPGTPAEAGVSVDIFAETEYPTLGVCLGHQALCAAHGVSVGRAPDVVHGKTSAVTHDGTGLYDGVPNPFEVGRYHSLAVERDDLPAELIETAYTDDDRGTVMGVRHAELPHIGVQFHPESILTESGKRIVENFCTAIAHG